MHAPESPGRWAGGAATLLILVFLVQSFTASRLKGPTADEPYHIAAALSYVSKGRIQINPQHPPLLKELSGLSLLAGGIRWPDNEYATRAWGGVEEMAPIVGGTVIAEQGISRTLFWARLPLIVVSALLGVLLYLWGRTLIGPLAALGAVFLFALDPTFLAHSYLVTTDCGIATGIVLFLYALWSYLHRPTPLRLAICGLCLGLSLAVKFSGVVVPPIAVLLLPIAALLMPRPAAVSLPWFLQPFGSTAVTAAGPVQAANAGRKGKAAPAPVPLLVPEPLAGRIRLALPGSIGAVLAMCAVAFLVLQAVYLFPHNPLAYLDGYRKVNADHDAEYLMYMAGEAQRHFSSYYLVACLVKLPLALILLAGAGLWNLRHLPWLNRAFLLLPAGALFAGYSIFSDNLGIRYIIPVLPFVYLAGGLGLASLLRGASKAARIAAVAAGVWVAVAAAGIYPDHISYFNEAACATVDPARIGLDGGSKCGPWWLDDSNVDWGGSLLQLKEWLDRYAPNRQPKLAYMSSFPPRAYGIDYERVDPEGLLADPTPGLYVVSAHYVARVPAMAAHDRSPLRGEWMRDRKPIAIVGHAYWVYDVPGK